MAFKRAAAFSNGSSYTTGSHGPNQYKKFFFHFGVSLADSANDQMTGKCPFCAKEGHFFANRSTGQWDCKRCGKKGNTTTFMARMVEHKHNKMTDSDYSWIEKQRKGIDREVLKRYEISRFNETDVLIPVRNKQGEISTVYMWKQVYDEESKKHVYRMLVPPTTKQQLIGLDRPAAFNSKILFICEGHWDFLALSGLLYRLNKFTQYGVIGVPGAGVFPKEQVGLLSNKEIRILYDNDEAGRNGTTSLLALPITPTLAKTLSFSPEDPSGHDIRDIIVKAKSPAAAWNDILKRLKAAKVLKSGDAPENYDPNVKSVPCDSIDDLLDSLSSKLTITEPFAQTFKVMLGIVASTRLAGLPLWSYIIGPPSSGKTTLAELACAAFPYTFPVSKFTGLLSGFKTNNKKDASILPMIQDKCFVIKDFTTVLSMTPTERDRIFGEMRDVYDGSAATAYRNTVARSYDRINFSTLACVTAEIRAYNETALGERFLQFEIDSKWEQDGTHNYIKPPDGRLDQSILNVLGMMTQTSVSSSAFLNRQKELTWGFIDHINSRIEDKAHLMTIGQNIQDSGFLGMIKALAKFIAHARTVCKRSNGELIYRPRIESFDRIAVQLTKLAVSQILIHGNEGPCGSTSDVIRKAGLDTAFGFPLEIMIKIFTQGGFNGLTKAELQSMLGIGENKVSNILKDMEELGTLKRCQPHVTNLNSRGRPSMVYRLAPDLADTAKILFTESPPANAKYSRQTGKLAR